jgi:hypothetical protein
MTKKLIILVILVLTAAPVFAQVDTAWVRRYAGPYGDDYAYAITVDDLKNVYVTGASRDSGLGYINDYATIKYDSLGVEQWVARYNGSSTRNWPDEARAITVDANGVYVTGYISYYISEDSSDYCTIKYDKTTGGTLWLRKYDGAYKCDQAYAIARDDSGNVYVTGKSKVDVNGFDYLTIKYSPDGVQRWTARYNNSNGNGWDMAYALAVDDNGNVYVTGSSYDLNTYYDCTTVKYNSSGVQQWVRRYSYQGNQSDEGDAIAVDASGNVYVAGRSISSTTSWDYVTIKYNAGGTQQWAKRYNGMANYDDQATGIGLDDSGNAYVTGKSGIGSFYYQYATVKYLSDGTQDWERTYIGPANLTAAANAIVVDKHNNVYVTGYDYASDTTANYVTIKYSSEGTQGQIARYSAGVPQGGDWATAICVDQDNYVYVTGYSKNSEEDFDYATIKYVRSSFEPSPQVVSTSPIQNALDVPINTNISVIFDIDMDPTTICDSTFVVNAWSTGLHIGTITYDSPTKTATLNPNVDFKEGEIVTVALTTDIKSSAGATMESSYVWSFTTKAEDGTACFAPATNYNTGDASVSVFCADLDGDGDLDLAVANWFGNSVSILKNNGDGTFLAAVNYGTGSYPTAVFCADMDGDNDLDIAVVNYGSDDISIFKNVGDGTFQNAINYATGLSPSSVFCADLDGDNDIDLAVANCGSDSISIFKNNGDGTFQAAANYKAGACPLSLFCADVDDDNDLDLIAANNWSDSVSILKNNGDGTFQNRTDYAVGSYPRSVFCADLDGDGDLDLAVANQYGNNVSVLKNNGDGTFQDTANYGAGSGPWSVFCADLDGDDALDLAVANAWDSVSILKNNGDGTFQAAINYAAGDGPFSIFCADVDGDNDLDIAVANYSSDNVSILLNIRRGDGVDDKVVDAGDVVFLINYLYRSGTAPKPLAVGDVNCDGVADVGDAVYLINYLFKSGPAPCC